MADLVFVVDVSQDIGEGDYSTLANYLANFASSINSGANGIRVGAVRFATYAENKYEYSCCRTSLSP